MRLDIVNAACRLPFLFILVKKIALHMISYSGIPELKIYNFDIKLYVKIKVIRLFACEVINAACKFEKHIVLN